MRATTKPLLALTAADLMTAPVQSIPQEMSLREAALLLRHSDITGAPVVNEAGECVGVLSASDFVTWAGEGEVPGERVVTSFVAPWGELVTIDEAADHAIARYMTARPVTVTPATPIRDLSRVMLDARVHRVLVVTEQGSPCGIVSSMDVVAALARAPREPVPPPANRSSRRREAAARRSAE